MRSKLLGILLLVVSFGKLTGQCSIGVSFSLNDTVCSADEVVITNTSSGVSDYVWDFNPLDLEAGLTPSATKLLNSGSINDLRGIAFAQDTITSEYYAFGAGRSPNRIISYQLNASLNDGLIFSDFGNPDNLLVNCLYPMRVHNNVGFISNEATNEVVQYYFSSGLNQAPDSSKVLSNLTNEYQTPGNVRIVEDQDSLYLLVSNRRNGSRSISILSFAGDLSNTPVLINNVGTLNGINGSQHASDFDIVKICNTWIVYALLNNGTFSVLNFGSSLENTPTVTLIPQISIPNIVSSLRVIHDDKGTYVHCVSSLNQLSSFRLDQTGLIFETPLYAVNNYFGNVSDTRSFDIIKKNSTYAILACNRTGNAASRGIHISNFQNEGINPSLNSTQFTPTGFTFNSSGMQYISLTGIDSLGSVSSYIDSVFIKEAVAVNFGSINNCLDFPVAYFDSSSLAPAPTAWRWDFGDGDTSILQNPMHSYAANGTYTIELAATAANGCVTNKFDTIEVSDLRPETPAFDYFPKTVCENTVVSFYDSTVVIQDSVISYFWDFGDGDTSVLQNPSHQYISTGVFNVSLRLTGRFGCDTTITALINVQAGPVPDFSAFDFCQGSPTLFTDLSVPVSPSQIISWKWNFGDGDTSILQNPGHVYSNSGPYNVAVQVETDSGCIASAVQTIQIDNIPSPNFDYSIPCALSDVSFTDESNGTIVEWEWKNILNQTDSSSSASFSFPSVGFQDVQLTVVNSAGCKDSITKTIEVFPAILPNFSVENICLNDTSQFTDETPSFSIISREWNFDFFNQTSNIENPKFYYSSPGSYDVRLSVINAIGCEADTVKTIEIKELPIASGIVENNCLGASTLFYDNSNVVGGSVVDMTWDIEGALLDTDSVENVFPDSDTYTVTHQIKDNFGCEDDTTFSFDINPLPIVDFSFAPNYGTAPITIQFTNDSQGGINYFWDFGDANNTSLDENPSYTYTSNDVYTINFTVENQFNCIDSVIKTIPIIPTELDIELSNLTIVNTTLVDGSNSYTARINMQNVGSRVIENVDLKASINQETKIVENWTGTLNIGQSILYDLSASFLVSDPELLDYLCVEAFNVNDNTEINLDNNKICALQQGTIRFSSLYPNPTDDIAFMDVITARKGSAEIAVYDLIGMKILDFGTVQFNEGFNQINFNCSNFQAGKYIIQMIYQDEVYSQSLIISNQ